MISLSNILLVARSSTTVSVATFKCGSRVTDSRLSSSRVLDELKALGIFHRRSILDRLVVRFVEESECRGVQVQEVTDFVSDRSSHFLIFCFFKPNLDQVLSSSDADACTNY